MANPHPKAGPGRPSKKAKAAEARRKLIENSPYPADYLVAVTSGKLKKGEIDKDRLDACKYHLNQVLGCAPTQTTITEPVQVVIKYANPPAIKPVAEG